MAMTQLPSTAPRSRGALRPLSNLAAALAVLAVLAPGAARPARADMVIQVADSSSAPGGTGSFDVTLQNTGGTFQIAGFSVELSVPAGSGVSFTGVTVDTVAAPYLFVTLQSPPFTFDTFPTQDFSATDFDLTTPGFITSNPDDHFGLAHVTYQVAFGAPGGDVTVSLVPAGTSLSDPNADGIPATLEGGSISIAGAIPEPSSLVLLGLGASLVAVARAGVRSGCRALRGFDPR
jgi:PEP-CTERM motif